MLPAFLRNDRQGAVSILFAGAALPMVGLLGLAIDYTFVSEARTAMKLAADTAAMSSVRVASNQFIADSTDSAWQTEGNQNANQWFAAQMNAVRDTTNINYSADVERNGVSFTSTVSYTGTVPTYFSAVLGFNDFYVNGAATATILLNAYVNIALLLDNSSSMLIGSTTADINTMQTITPCSKAAATSAQGMSAWTGPTPAACTTSTGGTSPASYAPCGFACHWSATAPDYYWLARNNPMGMTPAGTLPQPPNTPAITLRFDVVQSASADVINQMASSEVIADQFGLSVFEFNSSLTKVYPVPPSTQEAGYDLNSDANSGLNAVQAITTPVVANNGDTDFPDSMVTLATLLTPGGDGSTSASPRKNLFIVTDGIQDYGSRQVGNTEGPMNNAAAIAACNTIKSMGITIYVLYTPYTALPQNPYYVSNINQYVVTPPSPNKISTALQACASAATDFYEADVPSQISAGLTALLKAAVKSPARITS